jgi:hypothetical protein
MKVLSVGYWQRPLKERQKSEEVILVVFRSLSKEGEESLYGQMITRLKEFSLTRESWALARPSAPRKMVMSLEYCLVLK